MMKKGIWTGALFVTALCLICCAAGCGENNTTADSAQIKKAVMNEGQIERYEPLQNQLETGIGLNILKVKDGVFYGMGIGPSGDGCLTKSFYTFDMEGSRENVPDRNDLEYMTAVEFPVDSGVWYCCQLADEGSRLSRVDYRTLKEEVLIQNQPNMNDDLNELSFGVDSQSVYFTKNNEIFRQPFAGGAAEKLTDNVGNVERLFVIDGQLYIDGDDACSVLDLSGGNLKKCFSGRLLGWTESLIYFAEKNQSGTVIKSYDVKSGAVTPELQIDFELDGIPRLQNGRYIIATQSESEIQLVDIVEKTVYDIDVQAVVRAAGRYPAAWYVDEHYLYAQSICDWDLGEETPDQFFRWKWR